MKECAKPGNRTCKTTDIRLDTLQTAISGMANILMSLSKVVKYTHKTNTDMHIFLNFIFKKAYNINGSNISSEIVHLLKVKLP